METYSRIPQNPWFNETTHRFLQLIHQLGDEQHYARPLQSSDQV